VRETVHACVPPLHAIQVISVGAVDWDGQPADFSTFNADVELAGPGVRTLSTIPLALTNESTYHALPYAHGLLALLALAKTFSRAQGLHELMVRPQGVCQRHWLTVAWHLSPVLEQVLARCAWCSVATTHSVTSS
jgi:hypothetical protein